MNYLLYGTNNYGIKTEIEQILKGTDSLNVSKYDLTEDLLKTVLNDAITMSLFAEKKVIICENAIMFSGVGHAEELLENYLQNPNPNTTLIFVLNNDKIDGRKKITKLMNKNGITKEFNTTSPQVIVKDLFKNYNISNTDINLLIDRVGSNLDILTNEIQKIILYKDSDLNISKEDILNLTYKNVDTDVFKLIDYIVTNEKKKALEIYYELIKRGEEPIKIIIMLANQFRIIYQTKVLRKKGYSEKDIADILKIHPYRIKLALNKVGMYQEKTLLKYIDLLAQMDLGIKNGTLNKNNSLEMFILEK